MINLPKTTFRLAAAFVFAISTFTTYTAPTASANSGGVVIRRMLPAGSVVNTSDQEYVELYNNSDTDIEVTGWCLQYNQLNLSCMYGAQPHVRIFMSARRSILIMNPALETMIQGMGFGYKADFVFTSAGNQIAVSGGSIRLVDGAGAAVDTLGWANGVAEGDAVDLAISAGKVAQRRSAGDGVLIDTNNNRSDFEVITEDINFSRGGIYEEAVVVDQCLNTPGVIEEVVPQGYYRDTNGNCIKDLCTNFPDLQAELPAGYYQDLDVCLPIKLYITELLPNAKGLDTGNEFIELHNPNLYSVNLAGYTLQLNLGAKKYLFDHSAVMQPGEYLVLSDTQSGIVLPNSSATVSLHMPDQTVLYETREYQSPKEGQSWSLIEGVWQFTSVATPGSVNYSPSEDAVGIQEPGAPGSSTGEGFAACEPGKFRNPETNRCKALENAAAQLSACAAGQERNPETNRCRKIGGTNEALKACAEGQERNPETNRCRKVEVPVQGTVLAASTSSAAEGPFKYKAQIIAALVIALLGYGLFEYRRDIQNYIEKVKMQARIGRPKR